MQTWWEGGKKKGKAWVTPDPGHPHTPMQNPEPQPGRGHRTACSPLPRGRRSQCQRQCAGSHSVPRSEPPSALGLINDIAGLRPENDTSARASIHRGRPQGSPPAPRGPPSPVPRTLTKTPRWFRTAVTPWYLPFGAGTCSETVKPR